MYMTEDIDIKTWTDHITWKLSSNQKDLRVPKQKPRIIDFQIKQDKNKKPGFGTDPDPDPRVRTSD